LAHCNLTRMRETCPLIVVSLRHRRRAISAFDKPSPRQGQHLGLAFGQLTDEGAPAIVVGRAQVGAHHRLVVDEHDPDGPTAHDGDLFDVTDVGRVASRRNPPASS
jgi:hypothetical protein